LKVPLTDCFLVFEIAFSCFCGRATPARYSGNVERIRQSLANQVNSVAALDATTRRCSLAVDPDMPSNYCGCRQASGLEKSTIKQPSINAQRISRRGHPASTKCGTEANYTLQQSGLLTQAGHKTGLISRRFANGIIRRKSSRQGLEFRVPCADEYTLPDVSVHP